MVEKAIFRPDPMSFSAQKLSDFLGEFMDLLLARPVETRLLLDLPCRDVCIDLDKGRLRVSDAEGNVFAVKCGTAYLAEHDIPLRISRKTVLRFFPTSGNRFKVRRMDGIFDIITEKLSQFKIVNKLTHQE